MNERFGAEIYRQIAIIDKLFDLKNFIDKEKMEIVMNWIYFVE